MGEGVRLLLDKGADPMIVSCDGQRAVAQDRQVEDRAL